MSDQLKLILIISLSIVAIAIVVILILNTRKASLKKDVDDLNIRFNAIKTIPLAFKLNKAQAMAKRNEDAGDRVKLYYEKYEEAQKHIDKIGEMIENIEDNIAIKNYSAAKEALRIVKENIDDSEKEVEAIDKFLEQFSLEESDQRENSTRLKERFRDLKLLINNNSNRYSISYDGLTRKIEVVEDLFSQSEEFMYINEYTKSQNCLEKIRDLIKELKVSAEKLPGMIADTKGVVPTLLDEVNRQYALTRQRGIYTEHLDIDDKLAKIQEIINEDVKTLTNGEIGNIEEHNRFFKNELNIILKQLSDENDDFQNLKKSADELSENINELKNLYNYVNIAYKKDKERFGLQDMMQFLEESEKKVNDYVATNIALNQDIVSNDKPSSVLRKSFIDILDKTKKDIDALMSYKVTFDKNATDEQRAKTQLIKLQVVLNEVEVKVLEYHLPTIATSYHDDLVSGRERIANIKALLEEVPLNINLLNEILDESIDFIYKFYNNVNNVVGMAIMVENAIVFGNKYRSSFPEVERDLSKAEFSYLNGEYTKALTMAISCMEKLFPNKMDSSYLENA